jgi:phosphodiesterase/alkaline phosphatase D-like protein
VILLIVLLIGLGTLTYFKTPIGTIIKGLLSGTGGATTVDTTAPVISNVEVTATTTSAGITWATNELASAQVEYGKSKESTSLTTIADDPTGGASIGVLPHSVTLTGLESSTRYYYRVKSKDAAGNEAVSDWKTFDTTAVE